MLDYRISYPWIFDSAPDALALARINVTFDELLNVVPPNAKVASTVAWTNVETGVEVVGRVRQEPLTGSAIRYTLQVQLATPALDYVLDLAPAFGDDLVLEGFVGELRQLAEFVDGAHELVAQSLGLGAPMVPKP